ncbi:hypothetical protein F5X68DRAFT_213790, partial [Plectosphaerella plurivora]
MEVNNSKTSIRKACPSLACFGNPQAGRVAFGHRIWLAVVHGRPQTDLCVSSPWSQEKESSCPSGENKQTRPPATTDPRATVRSVTSRSGTDGCFLSHTCGSGARPPSGTRFFLPALFSAVGALRPVTRTGFHHDTRRRCIYERHEGLIIASVRANVSLRRGRPPKGPVQSFQRHVRICLGLIEPNDLTKSDARRLDPIRTRKPSLRIV